MSESIQDQLELILTKFANRVLDVQSGKENPTLGELVDTPVSEIVTYLEDTMPKRKTTGYCETEWDFHGEQNKVNGYNQAIDGFRSSLGLAPEHLAVCQLNAQDSDESLGCTCHVLRSTQRERLYGEGQDE